MSLLRFLPMMRAGLRGIDMPGKFVAQSLTETRISEDRRRFELTFAAPGGAKQVVSIPASVAADLVPVLASLTSQMDEADATLTRMPKECAVGYAAHERLVMIKFDDEPPYALGLREAEALWREIREETESVSDGTRLALQ